MKAYLNLVMGTVLVGVGMATNINNETWSQIVEAVSIGLGIIAAGGGVNNLIKRLKRQTKWNGTAIYVLSWLLSGIVAIGGALIAGQITPELVEDWPKLLLVVFGVLFASEKQYRFQRDERLDSEAEVTHAVS